MCTELKLYYTGFISGSCLSAKETQQVVYCLHSGSIKRDEGALSESSGGWIGAIYSTGTCP